MKGRIRILTFFLCIMNFFYGHTEDNHSKINFRIETSGFNNYIVKGVIKGNFSDLEEIHNLTLHFKGSHASTDYCDSESSAPRNFNFQGQGGFFPTFNLKRLEKESIEKTFSENSIPYLNNGFISDQKNTAAVLGNLKGYRPFFFVFFGEINPYLKIQTGEFWLILKGSIEPSQEEHIIGQGKVKIYNQKEE